MLSQTKSAGKGLNYGEASIYILRYSVSLECLGVKFCTTFVGPIKADANEVSPLSYVGN
jgi:hypothetical protein